MMRSARRHPGPASSRRPDNPWDLRKVAGHLPGRLAHRAGSCTEDLADGPDASVDRLLHPAVGSRTRPTRSKAGGKAARASSNLELLKVCWLNHVLPRPDPLHAKLRPLFWSGHFATSNKKVELGLSARRTVRMRRCRPRPGRIRPRLLEAMIADPAMSRSGSTGERAKRDKPNESTSENSSSCSRWAWGTMASRTCPACARRP